MTREEVTSKVKKIVSEEIGVSPEEVGLHHEFEDDLGMDSLDISAMLVGVEEEFNITIPERDSDTFTTVASLVDWCHAEINA